MTGDHRREVRVVDPTKTPHFLKWVGGKRRLAKTIRAQFSGPCTGTYIEPFVGSGAVFLERAAAGEVRHATLSDISAALMCVHQTLRDDVDAVIGSLQGLPREEGTWQAGYYERRAEFNAMKAEAEAEDWSPKWIGVQGPDFTALFLWINRACFNGMYRENRKGQFNVPVGRYKHLSIPSEATLLNASRLLASTRLVTDSFEVQLTNAGPGDQIYCDPPYVPLSDTANFVSYSKDGFDWSAHQRLADLAASAAGRGARVVVSNSDVPEVGDLYATYGFTLNSVDVQRSVGAKVRGRARELIAVKGGICATAC